MKKTKFSYLGDYVCFCRYSLLLSIIKTITDQYGQISESQHIQYQIYKLPKFYKIILFTILAMNDIFNQRGPRPTNQMYYFQLIPNTLSILNPTLAKSAKSSNIEFRLKIIKGTQLVDEMKKAITAKMINGKATFQQIQLNFNIPSFNPNRNIQFILVLLKTQQGEQETEVGRYSLMSTQFVMEYKNNKMKFFQTNINMSQDYSLAFELYVENSRFSLQKLIKQKKQQKKQGKIQNMLQISKKGSANEKIPVTLNDARSERIQNNAKVQVVIPGEDRFISPTRKIVRKQSQSRKLLTKQSSPEKSQSQSNSKRQLKFLARNSQTQTPQIKKIQSLAEQQSRNLSQKKKLDAEKQKQQANRIQKQIRQKQARQNAQSQRKKSQILKAEQARKKKQQQQSARKAEEDRLAAQQKRNQAQKKRQQQKVKRQQQSQRKREQQQIKKAQQEQRRRQQAQRQAKQAQKQRKLQQSRKAKQLRITKKISQPVSQTAFQPVAITNKQQKSDRPETDRKPKRKQSTQSGKDESKTVFDTKKPTMTVRIKAETPRRQQQYVFTTNPTISKQDWEKPLNIRKTGSDLFDHKGNLIKQSAITKKQSGQQMDTKTKVILIVFCFLSVLLMLNAMTPSRKR